MYKRPFESVKIRMKYFRNEFGRWHKYQNFAFLTKQNEHEAINSTQRRIPTSSSNFEREHFNQRKRRFPRMDSLLFGEDCFCIRV